MKTSILRYELGHNVISLSLENGMDFTTELTSSDLWNLDNGKKPAYWTECETWDGYYSCYIEWK